MKPCIIILAYPDTDNKIDILSDTINSVKALKSGGKPFDEKCSIPTFVFSNLDIDRDELPEVDDFIYSGSNKMLSASDFFSIEMITKSRELTKYRHNLMTDTDRISYVPITYGTEKNYYWALTELYQLAFQRVKQMGFTHFMVLQELNLGSRELQLVSRYFNDMIQNDLDGIVAFEPDQGAHHLSDFVFFGKTSWWCELFNSMTAENFYFLSYPNFTIEEYYHRKMILKGGKIKYKVRRNISTNQLDYWTDSPPTWQKEILDIDCNTTCTWKLFFPGLSQTKFISNSESYQFDVHKCVDVAVLTNNQLHDIFLWNRSDDKLIEVNIISSHPDVKNIHLFMKPQYYYTLPTDQNLKNTEITVAFTYFDGGQKCSTKFYQV